MKKIYFISILILFFSCKEYKALMSEKTIFNSGKKMHFNSGEMEAFNVSINGFNHNLFFDTGAGVTLINTPFFNIDNDKIIRQKKIYGFDKKTISTSTTYTVDSVKTKIFETKNKHIYISKIETNNKCVKNKYDGILGNFFSEIELDKEIMLNYEKGYIEISNSLFAKKGYYPVEAKFSSISGKFYIKLDINGVKDFFLFDTGNKTGILLNPKNYKTFTTDKVASFSSINFAVNNTSFLSRFSIYQSNLKISDELVFNQYFAINPEIERSTLNQQFIKKFNWIINRKDNKVYCKPIIDIQELNSIYKLPSKSELVSINENIILVSFCVEDKSKYSIGDQIKSINNIEVTPDNICKMKDLLNSTENWDTLDLEIFSTK